MRPTGIILAVIFGFLALAATVWIGRYDAQPPAIIAPPPDPYEGLQISETGPHPKAVADETEFDFGTLSVGSEGEHIFIIKNEGEGDLQLKKGRSTCSCTVGELSDDSKIPPGGTVEIKLNWKIKMMTPTFRHSASVYTNDPDHRELQFTVTGKVDEVYLMRPNSPWEAGELTSGDAVVTGYLGSNVVSEFEIKSISNKNEWAKVEATPMTQQELEQHEVKSGYKLTATLTPSMPVGPFSEDVTLETTLPDTPTAVFRINGSRPGPLELFGPNFRPEANALILGEFPASEGKSATISLFARDLDGDLELLGYDQEFNSCKVELVKDEKLAGKAKRYFLKVNIPPGAPQDRMRKKSEKINLKLNHPDAPALRLIVEFLAT